MKKLLKYLMLMLVATFSLTFVSCSGDDDDEPDNPSNGITTNFGVVKATGVHTISLFCSAHDGETTLELPGFATMRIEGHYNIYKHIVTSVGIYADDEGNEFAHWNPGESIPSSFDKRSSEANILVRTKVKNSNEYVYAYIQLVRYLEESTGGMDGNVIGAIYKYQSPIDPTRFTGFE